MNKFRVTSVKSVPFRAGVKLEEFDEDEEAESWPFRELIDGLTWLAISTRPDISNKFYLLRDTVSRRRPSTEKQRLVFSYISRFLLVLALHIREGHQ